MIRVVVEWGHIHKHSHLSVAVTAVWGMMLVKVLVQALVGFRVRAVMVLPLTPATTASHSPVWMVWLLMATVASQW